MGELEDLVRERTQYPLIVLVGRHGAVWKINAEQFVYCKHGERPNRHQTPAPYLRVRDAFRKANG